MKKVIVITVLINLITIFPVYAANKIGIGIDFHKEEEENSWEGNYDEDSTELRLYCEHLLTSPLGVQFELGLINRDTSWHQKKDIVDLAILLKYYFPLKGRCAAYIGGGAGYRYSKSEDTDDKQIGKNYDFTEQATIGVELPFAHSLAIFIEDRFESVFSEGEVRVGLYLNL